MLQEKRPTCVTVIGWVWIIIGGLMCFSAAMALFSSIMIGQMAQDDPNMPFIFKVFPLLAVAQIIVAIFGLFAGVNFLKLKSWSRKALEILTWALILFVVGFGGVTVFHLVSTSSSQLNFGFGIMEFFLIIVILGMYAVPLVIMVKYLRGEKVKQAMISIAEHL